MYEVFIEKKYQVFLSRSCNVSCDLRAAQTEAILRTDPQSQISSEDKSEVQIYLPTVLRCGGRRVEQVVEEPGVRKEASGLLQRLMQIAVPLLPRAGGACLLAVKAQSRIATLLGRVSGR